MTTFSQTPVYNLKAVLLETGLKADVLRAWERRYGLPSPHRTAGGHRLYSAYDIEILRWLKSRQEEGLSISKSVKLWHEMFAAGSDPLAAGLKVGSQFDPVKRSVNNAPIEELRHAWVEANLAFDSENVNETLNQAFAMYTVETVCVDIILRGISQIGDGWYHDRVSVQQEHFASALAERRLEALIAAMPRPTRRQSVLVGGPAGERHTLPILMLSFFLIRSGLRVIYLGADVPIEQLNETAKAVRPDLIVLAAQQLTTAAALQSVAFMFQDLQIPMAYGGLIFNRIPRLRTIVPGLFLGEALKDSTFMIENILKSSKIELPFVEPDHSYRPLAGKFLERRAQIEKDTFDLLQAANLSAEHIAGANKFFGDEILAALQLGDPAFLGEDLDWVRKLLTGRNIPAKQLSIYLDAYRSAFLKSMDVSGATVTDWIGAYIERLANHVDNHP